MAKEYHPTTGFNRFAMLVNRLGLGRSATLTTTGHRSALSRDVPVSPIVVDGVEYIVAPYGVVGWVRNVRANPIVTMRSGRDARQCRLVEVTEEAAPVVKAYWDKERFPRPYMDVPGEGSVDDFDSIAGRFPVFRVEPAA